MAGLALAALGALVPATASAAADDAKQAAAAVRRIPALRGTTLSELTAVPNAPGAYTGKLGSRAVDVLVVGARRKEGGPIWVAALTSEARTARELLAPDLAAPPGGGSDLLGQLALADTVVVLSEHEGELRVPEMPPALRQRLQRLGAGPIALRPGVNVAANVRVAISGLVGDLVKTLGIAPPLAPLTGRLPATSVGALAGPVSGHTNVDEVDLALHLPAILPPGLEAILGSDPLAFTIKGDKGKLVAGGATTLRLHGPGGGTVTAQATLSVDPNPAEGGAFLRLGGAVTPLAAVLPPIPIPGLAVDQLTLELAVLRKGAAREPAVGFHGKGRLGGNPLDLTATLAQTPDRRTEVTLSVAGDLKLANLLGHAVPGLDAVMLRRVSLGRDRIGGTVRVGTKDITALVYTPAGKSKPNLALGDSALALTDFVPALRGTPLADLALSNAALLVVPPDNAARGLSAAGLPAELVTLLGGPQADVLSRGIDLRAGITVLATLDVSRSRPLHALLDAVGVTATRLPLAGGLDPELFRHTPWGGSAGGAGALARSFLDNLDLAVPLPALTLPGGASALRLTAGSLVVRGDKGQPWLGIQTGAEIALADRKLTVAPLTLTAGTGGVTLTGTVSGTSHAAGDVKQLVAFPGLTVTSVTFTGQVDAQRRLSAGLGATGTLSLPGGQKTIGLKVALDSSDPKAGSVQVTTALKVNDFAGTPVPGIGDLTFTGLTLTPTWTSGTVRFRNEDTTVLAWTPTGARGHRFALLHDKLKIGTYVSAAAGTPLGDLELDRAALIYVPAGGGATGIPADGLPAPLVDALGGKSAAVFPLDLPEGVTVSALARLPASGPVAELLGGLGLSQHTLPLRGTLDPTYLAGAARRTQGKWPRFDVAMDLPAFRPPGTADHVVFDKGRLVVKPKPDGSFYTALTASVTVTLDPQHVLAFHGEFTRSGPGVLSFSADAKASLKAPFGIQWLALDELDVSATIDRPKRAVDVSVGGRTGIAGHPVTVAVHLDEQGGKLQDVIFALKGHVPLSVVPGLGRLPGVGDLVLVDPEVSRTHLSGELDFRGGKIRAALFSMGGGWNALLETTALHFDKLFPDLNHGPLKGFSLPQAALLVSQQGFTQKTDDLAPAIQQMLAALGLKAGDPVIAVPGVNIVTTLDPRTLTGPLKQALDHLGIQDPVVLGGAVGGIFGGPPSLSLEAVLPRMPTPPIKFLRTRGSADARLLLSLAPTELRIGIGTDVQVHVGPDDLTFSADLGLIVNPSTIALDVTGRLQGDWHNPLGIKGLTVEAVSLTVGGELTGAVDLAVGGQVKLGSDDVLVAAGASLLVEALGTPKAIGLVGKVDRLRFGALVDRAAGFVLAETGAHLPAGDHPREAVELDQVLVAFMTPGVVLDPKLLQGAQLQIQGAGLALAGRLRLDGKEVGRVDGWASTRGLKLSGEVAPFDIGPVRLDKGVVDVQASTTGVPHFRIQTQAEPLGARVQLDVTLDSKGIAFTTKDKIGGQFEIDLAARTTNGLSLKKNDFAVHANLRADFADHLRALLTKELNALFAELDAGEKKLAADLDKARAAVAEREREEGAARREVQRESKAVVQDVNQVGKQLAQLDRRANELRARIRNDLAEVRKAVHDLRLARAAELREEVAALQVEVAGLEASHAATEKVLEAVKAGAQTIPPEADPRVLAAVAALESARARATLLDVALRAARAVIADLRAAATRLEQADVLDVRRARVDGTLGTTLRVAVDARLFGKEDVTAAGSFAPKDAAAKAASVAALAKDLATRLLAHKKLEHEHPPEPPTQTATAATGTGSTPGASSSTDQPTPAGGTTPGASSSQSPGTPAASPTAPTKPDAPASTQPSTALAKPDTPPTTPYPATGPTTGPPARHMTYERWMKDTTAGILTPRSTELKALDQAVKAYDSATDDTRVARKADVGDALAHWKVKEGPGDRWRSSVRNKLRAVEILDTEVKASSAQAGCLWLYRRDSRAPEVIFADGFSAKGTNMDLGQHVEGSGQGGPSGYVSTTKAQRVAFKLFWQANETSFKPDWIYEMRDCGCGVDVNQTLDPRKLPPGVKEKVEAYRYQEEVAIPGRINPEDVSWAVQPREQDRPASIKVKANMTEEEKQAYSNWPPLDQVKVDGQPVKNKIFDEKDAKRQSKCPAR
jgi:hypothetical protein